MQFARRSLLSSVDMIDFPGNLVESDGLQEFYDIFASVVMWCTVLVLTHEDDWHIGEELG